MINKAAPALQDRLLSLIPDSLLLTALGIEEQPDFQAATPTPEMIAQRYKDYYDTVNMTYSELQRWSETECSRKAGLNRAPIMRNLELLNINKPDWTEKHYRWAGQTIAFINRMKNGEQGEDVADCGMSKRDISLKNWAYDVDK